MSEYEVPPVLLLVFKRPETTQTVFNAIRAAKPKRLFVGADGPRENRPDEALKVQAVRKIVQQVDWDCKVQYLFQEKNVGSKVAESTAISFFFEHVEEGIILEEDCLPDASFFQYCAVLLERYRHDARVMHISGNNFLFDKKIGDGSYYFSQVPLCWGWASWRRAWKLHDPDMRSYPEFKAQKRIDDIISDRHIRREYTRYYDECFKTGNAWDYPWSYTVMSNHGICISPNINLVANIGFGGDATTCANDSSLVANVTTGSMAEMVHPAFMVPHLEADKAVFYRFHPPRFIHFFAEFVRMFFPRPLYELGVRGYLRVQRWFFQRTTRQA